MFMYIAGMQVLEIISIQFKGIHFLTQSGLWLIFIIRLLFGREEARFAVCRHRIIVCLYLDNGYIIMRASDFHMEQGNL